MPSPTGSKSQNVHRLIYLLVTVSMCGCSKQIKFSQDASSSSSEIEHHEENEEVDWDGSRNPQTQPNPQPIPRSSETKTVFSKEQCIFYQYDKFHESACVTAPCRVDLSVSSPTCWGIDVGGLGPLYVNFKVNAKSYTVYGSAGNGLYPNNEGRVLDLFTRSNAIPGCSDGKTIPIYAVLETGDYTVLAPVDDPPEKIILDHYCDPSKPLRPFAEL